MCLTYITQSQEHQWTQPAIVVYLIVMLFRYILVRSVEARPAEQHTQVTLSHLDSGLLVDAEQGNVRHANEGPFLVGPEHDDGSSLWGFSRNVKVGEANAS